MERDAPVADAQGHHPHFRALRSTLRRAFPGRHRPLPLSVPPRGVAWCSSPSLVHPKGNTHGDGHRGHTALADLEQLAPQDHLCSIYDSPEEHFAVAIPFIRIGLDRGEKCFYIADDGTEPVVREAMSAEGIDVERAIATDSLVLQGRRRTWPTS